jgi:non-ribosomal peptide synthetase component F
VLGAYAHQDVPFEQVVEALRPDRDPAYNPFFQIMLGFLTAPEEALAFPEVQVTPVDAPHKDSMFDLLVQVEETRDGHVGYFTYSTDLYDEETILRLIGNFEHLLKAAVVIRPGGRASRRSRNGTDPRGLNRTVPIRETRRSTSCSRNKWHAP